jgi:hypothetical protein
MSCSLSLPPKTHTLLSRMMQDGELHRRGLVFSDCALNDAVVGALSAPAVKGWRRHQITGFPGTASLYRRRFHAYSMARRTFGGASADNIILTPIARTIWPPAPSSGTGLEVTFGRINSRRNAL